MKNEQKKLEELMYLSLIGKFVDIQLVNQQKIACFSTANRNEKNVAPIYLTGTDVASDNVLLRRISTFENKIFDKEYLDGLKNLSTIDDKVCLIKRMKTFTNTLKTEKDKRTVLSNFKTNTNKLYKAEMISEDELRIVDEFVNHQFGKDKKSAPTLRTYELK